MLPLLTQSAPTINSFPAFQTRATRSQIRSLPFSLTFAPRKTPHSTAPSGWTTSPASAAQTAAADQNRKAEYGEVLPSLQKSYTEQAPYLKANQFLRECMIGGTEIYYFALRAGALKKALENGKAEEIEAAKKSLDDAGKAFHKNYYNKSAVS